MEWYTVKLSRKGDGEYTLAADSREDAERIAIEEAERGHHEVRWNQFPLIEVIESRKVSG